MSTWTDERVELLKKLWATEMTGSQIGRQMGINKNQVIGKVHRLGLSGREKAPPRKAEAPQPRLTWRTDPRRPLVPKPIPEPIVTHAAPPSLNLTLLDLEWWHCRWPYGDAEFTFCGAPAQDGSSYCQYHHGVSYPNTAKREAA